MGLPKSSRPAARQSTAWISTSASISSSPISRALAAGCRAPAGTLVDDHLALDALHHVERRADDPFVVADREHLRARAPGVSARARSSRASRSTSCALGGSGGRGGRRSTNSSPAALDQVGDVRVALADRARADLALAEAVGVEERLERVEHEQGRAAVSLPLRRRADDVVWRDRCAHGREPIATATFPALRCLNRPCPDSAPSHSPSSPRLLGRRDGAAGRRRRLAEPDHLLRGRLDAARKPGPGEGLRPDAGARRQSAAHRALLGLRRPRRRAAPRSRPSTRPTPPPTTGAPTRRCSPKRSASAGRCC